MRRWCTTLRRRRGRCRLSGHGDRCGCTISTCDQWSIRSTRRSIAWGIGQRTSRPWSSEGTCRCRLSADATAAWRPSPSGRPGAPKPFSDCAIETALTLRRVVRWPLRHAAGCLRSVLSVLGVDLDAPDHPTLSRRSQSLAVACRRLPSSGPIHLIVDSTGLSMVGEGAWATRDTRWLRPAWLADAPPWRRSVRCDPCPHAHREDG